MSDYNKGEHNVGMGMAGDIKEEKYIAKLEARLAEVEKESKAWESRANGLDVDLAMLGNELFKARERLTAAENVIEVAREGYSFRHELEEYDATK